MTTMGTEGIRLGREVSSEIGCVAAEPPAASEIGARILADGGNAFDAAAGAALACCMARPEMTGIAGYLLAGVVLDASTDVVWSLDANSVSPRSAHETMFDVLAPRTTPIGINEDEYLCSVADDANLYGASSVGVPGVMAGIGTLWERWGSLAWADIVGPSIELVQGGIAVAELTARMSTEMAPVLARFPETVDILMPGGVALGEGEVWHRPDMADTLTRLADHGWRDMYEGELCGRIIDAIQAGGGLLTNDDMRTFTPRISAPYRTTYRDAEIFGPVLPNGCVTTLQILNMLEALDVHGDDELAYWHRLAEVLKIAWRDRLLTLGDPDHVEVDVEQILDKADALARTAALREQLAAIDRTPLDPTESTHGTLHVSAADARGNVVALTLTHGAAFGSCMTVPGTGVILGHGMSRLDPRPGHKNSVAGAKRPLNNVAPTITRLADRDVASGLPGGRRIVSVAAQLVQRLVDFTAGPLAAVDSPRLHVTHWGVDVTDTLDPSIVEGLRGLGHEVSVCPDVGGGAQVTEFDRSDSTTRAASGKGASAGA